jgi:hypothetical protein
MNKEFEARRINVFGNRLHHHQTFMFWLTSRFRIEYFISICLIVVFYFDI